jgi:hypothetical protein
MSLRLAAGTILRTGFVLGLLATIELTAQSKLVRSVSVDLAEFQARAGVAITQSEGSLQFTWEISPKETGMMTLSLDRGQPLIEALGVIVAGRTRPILRHMNPVVWLTVGERDLLAPAGWMAFFDNPPLRAHHTFPLKLARQSIRVASQGARTLITLEGATAGSFSGHFQFTIFPGSPLVQAEAVLSTLEDGRAILYDAGLATPTPNTDNLGGGRPSWQRMAWRDEAGSIQRVPVDVNRVAGPISVTRRAIAAEAEEGTVAIFPPPHQYFYPLDFATNLGFAWFGRSGDQWLQGYGFGIQQPPAGDKRWVPWCNAPPGTAQRLGVFYLVTEGDAGAALAAVGRYTRDDHFMRLPGYVTFSSHYHIEHTLELTRKRQELRDSAAIPPELKVPGFVRTFKVRGVDIVHLAELHIAETPTLPTRERLALLKTMHEECARLSDDELLVLPGEEPNVHLGGHWISLFPKPVYWVLNRSDQKPFAEEEDGYGTVYHVGNAQDVLHLMEKENGLMWTAHPRIKGSRGYPESYWDEAFFRSDRFLGGAWKSMPVDLSLPKLGTRALDVQDAMANRGERKYMLGEVDIFRVEPEMETYAHMNINYLRLDRVPRYADGWRPVLDALRGGRFFVSTGEVLIPEFTIEGKKSGEVLKRPPDGRVELRARLEGTFPMSFAEIVSGDGLNVYRQRIDLNDTPEFTRRNLVVPINIQNRTWVRLEVWDVARNGAFTPPIWLE